MVVMLVLTVGGIAVAGLIANTTRTLVGTERHSQLQGIIDAGIAAQTTRLETGALPCSAHATGEGVAMNDASYSYALSCANGVAKLHVSAENEAGKAAREAVFSYQSDEAPPTAGGPGLFYTYNSGSRFNSYVFDRERSEVSPDEFAGAASVYATNGNISCGYGSVFPGDLYTKTGNLQLDSGCLVEGSAYIGGTAKVNGGTIKGSLIAPSDVNHIISGPVGTQGKGGDVILGGTFTLNNGTVYGNLSAASTKANTLGSGTVHGNLRYKGSYNTWGTPANNIVKGSITKDASLVSPVLPEIPDWQDVAFQPVNATTPPKAWADEGYALTTVTGAACEKWAGNSADVTSLAGTLAQRMIFDIRACGDGFDTNAGGANKTVAVNKDIAIIANSWRLSGTKFESADGNPHTVFLITPDSQPTAPGPQCNAPARDSQQVNDSTVASNIAVYIYTPCEMKFNAGNATFRGQVYAGKLDFGGGVKIAFAPRHIPGYDFGKDVSSGGSGGGGTSPGGKSTFSLVSSTDVAPS